MRRHFGRLRDSLVQSRRADLENADSDQAKSAVWGKYVALFSLWAASRRSVCRVVVARPGGVAVASDAEGLDLLQDHLGDAFVTRGGASAEELERMRNYVVRDAWVLSPSLTRNSSACFVVALRVRLGLMHAGAASRRSCIERSWRYTTVTKLRLDLKSGWWFSYPTLLFSLAIRAIWRFCRNCGL